MLTTSNEILLVEDNMNDAELTIRALRKNNFANNIVHLKDGAEALDYIFKKGEYENQDINMPKVILLDLNMPKIGGIQVLEKIKADPKTKTIPVVVLTSSSEDPDIKKCYELGVNSYVTKPVDFEDFMKAVSELGLYWLLVNHPSQ
jgi:two-component system, response regulator